MFGWSETSSYLRREFLIGSILYCFLFLHLEMLLFIDPHEFSDQVLEYLEGCMQYGISISPAAIQ